jgi:hypothetical protein
MNEQSPDELCIAPWIGEFYQKAHVKILILGESHYATFGPFEKATPSFTNDLVHAQVKNGGVRFLTKTANMVSGQKLPSTLQYRKHRIRFWYSVSYTNFVGEIFASRARVAPPRLIFDKWAERYEATLSRLNPDIVFVCGDRLWRDMYRNFSPKISQQGSNSAILFGHHHFLAHHPSSTVTYSEWWDKLNRFAIDHNFDDRLDRMRRFWHP